MAIERKHLGQICLNYFSTVSGRQEGGASSNIDIAVGVYRHSVRAVVDKWSLRERFAAQANETKEQYRSRSHVLNDTTVEANAPFRKKTTVGYAV